jgi:hypothetical protein
MREHVLYQSQGGLFDLMALELEAGLLYNQKPKMAGSLL